ncbi:cytochrome P450 [Streptomyces xanthophaeus]|uniref:cytochrome P450 n=1 Tax=Streptomyces xanthophaeus TaxID=67385 RepID=UPI003436F0FB
MSSRVADAPGAWPLLGHLPQLRRGPLEFMKSLSGHGGLVRIRLGPVRAYVVCEPALVQQMLREPAVFDKGGILFDKARQIVANGLATSAWTEHQRQRPLVQPAFTRARLEAYTPVMAQEADALIGMWPVERPVDIVEQMVSLSARITARTLFGSDLDRASIATIQQAIPVVAEGVYRQMTAPLRVWEKLPTSANRKYRRAAADLHAVIDRVIEKCEGATGERPDGEDMLSALLDAREGEERLSRAEVHEQSFTFMMAGVETTATALSWTLHLLARHPEVQERLHAEITRVLGGRVPTVRDLSRLEYTRGVLTEAMRLYPPVWLLTRSTTADAGLGQWRIPAGSSVVFSPYMLHHDARLFPDPERFDPDRWCSPRGDNAGQRGLFPFGGGARKCIGDVFSLTEAMIALVAISTRWHLTPGPGPEPRPVAKVVLTPDRVIVVAHPRPTPDRDGADRKPTSRTTGPRA